MAKKGYQHQSVLLPEAIAGLAIKKNGIYIDATLGRGGHSEAILRQLGSDGKLISIDKDPDAIAACKDAVEKDLRWEVVQGSFNKLEEVAEERGLKGKISGVLFDLGVSSPQLEDPERGFSFIQAGPLDMRMDTTKGKTAAEWLAKAKEEEISRVLYEFAEEKFSRRIARSIVNEREIAPIQTTDRLAEIVSKAIPRWEKGKHPATRSFQAIRIFINEELSDLTSALKQALEILEIGGRLAVISFHSLEDRIVKNFMREQTKTDELPHKLPIVFKEGRPKLQLLGRAIKPSATEVAVNPRSRSAVLRIAEKLS